MTTRTALPWLLLVLLGLFAPGAGAVCHLSHSGPATVTFSLPASITIPTNTPDGTVIATTAQVAPANPSEMDCNAGLGENVSYGVVNARGGAEDSYTYATGIPGVSYRITDPNADPAAHLTAYPLYSQNVTKKTFNATSGLELVKTGPITSGNVLAAGKLADWQWGTLVPVVFQLASSVILTLPSCTVVTNPINVTLPNVLASTFTGVGTTSGKTPFAITLSCPAGTAVSNVTLHAATPDSHPGVIQPAGAGYAAGIGVQILDGNSNPVTFERQTLLTPGATNSIPYYAQYFQTAPTAGAGTVKATVTFDLFYQ
ncbi:MAG TPA: fimbrial protein [Rhodanobacter sp.]|jgi:P pilus assembly protein, pilin FimA